MAFFLKLAKNCWNPLVSQAQEEALTETVLEFATSSLGSPTNRYGKEVADNHLQWNPVQTLCR